MGRVFYALAAILSLSLAAAHAIVGGQLVVGTVLATPSIDPTVQWLSFFSWHFGTIVMIVSAAAFALIGLGRVPNSVGLILCIQFALVGLFGLVTAIYSGALWTSPAPYAFSVIAATSALAARFHQ